MSKVVYRGVYLRRMKQGKHLIAVDPGDGVTEYIEFPLLQEESPVGLEARTRHHPRDDQKFVFGELVDVTIASTG